MMNILDGGLLITSPFRQQNMLNEKVTRYAGFDGEMWPESNTLPGLKEDLWETGLVPNDLLRDLVKVYRAIPKIRNARLLYICSDKNKKPRYDDEFHFVGIDVGYYNSSYSHFSCVLNELARGLIEDHSGKWRLNDATLFDEYDVASGFLSERLAMLNSSRKLEDISDNKPILIYTYRYIGDDRAR